MSRQHKEFMRAFEKTDNVDHPAHYTQDEIECIDAIKAALGPIGFNAFLQGQVIKYMWRFEHKGGLEDLRKAQWYLSRLIEEKDNA